MRQKRAKAYRKLMSLYSMSFGFRQPYQTLGKYRQDHCVTMYKTYSYIVDSEMCKESISHKIDLAKQLGVVLQGTVKPSELLFALSVQMYQGSERERRSCLLVITQCCIHELYLQGKSQQPAVDLAKTFERRKCNHREAIPGDDCLSSVVGA